MLSSSAPWDDLKFAKDELKNIHRTLNILWNVYRFPLPYMVLDEFDPSRVSLESVKPHLRKEDRWILSRAQSLVAEVDDAMSSAHCTGHSGLSTSSCLKTFQDGISSLSGQGHG